jgi:hypothetical protein
MNYEFTHNNNQLGPKRLKSNQPQPLNNERTVAVIGK